jgi:GntR family transcriptional regulator
MAIWIQITPGSDKPIYTQIVEQVSEAIARGQLSTGEKLPAVRKLAGELVVNPNTVARAYAILEQSGLVTTKTGSGTFAAKPKLKSKDSPNINILTEKIDGLLIKGLNLGLDISDIIEIFKSRAGKFSRIKNEEGKRQNG